MLRVVIIVVAAVTGLAVLFFFGGKLYTQKYSEELLEKLEKEAPQKPELFLRSDSINLPTPVRAYLDNVVPDTFRIPKLIKITQTGELKTSAESEWNKIEAVQYYSPYKPGYIWDAKMSPSSFADIRALDSYVDGTGSMLIKVFSSITITDAKGPQMDISALYRYFSEAVFFPYKFYPSQNVEWFDTGLDNAQCMFRDDTLSGKMNVFFNTRNEISRIETFDKYRFTNSGFSNELNITYYSDYREFKGLKIPYKGSVAWDYKGKLFEYGRFEVKEIEYFY